MKLSVIIIAKNEEESIGGCLKTVRWANEILVVDTGSIDKTLEIVKKHGARIIKYTSKGNYSDWRNKGLKEAKGEWILYIDADERVTPELKKEIQAEINYRPLNVDHFNAYAIPRRNFIFGKEMKYGGWSPDYVKRLFKRSELEKWTGELHEEPKFKGELGHLKSPMIHKKNLTLSDMVEKTNKWSQIEAKLMFESRHPEMNILRFMSAVFREFWHRMIVKTAFLDGPRGIIYALYQVFSRFVSYAKLWEMQITKK